MGSKQSIDGRSKDFLSRLGDASQLAIFRLGRSQTYRDGDRLIREGEKGNFILLLTAGFVKVTASVASGREVLLAVRTRGDVVGELGVADGEPRNATIRATGSVAARRISADDWSVFLRNNPDAVTALNAALTSRFRVETRRRVDAGRLPAGVRIARTLIDFIGDYGVSAENGWMLPFDLTQVELASAAECGEAVAHSALQVLRQRKIITTAYRRQLVLDMPALERFAELR